jgi:hypothetical protein
MGVIRSQRYNRLSPLAVADIDRREATGHDFCGH